MSDLIKSALRSVFYCGFNLNTYVDGAAEALATSFPV
jgi:hypothetical protein